MPKRILIIGLLFCLGGVLAIWEVASDLFRSHINVNFAVLLLPVGIGILKGKKSSQWWGRFWIILGYIGCVLLVMASLLFSSNVSADFFGKEIKGVQAVPFAIVGAMLFTALFMTMHRLLYSEVSQAYFTRMSEVDGR